MKRFGLVLVCLAFTGVGVAAAPFCQWLWRSAVEAGDAQCVGTVCVGEEAVKAFDAYGLSTRAGGLEAVVCGRGREATYIWWPDYVFTEQACELSQQTIIMRSPQYQTNFEIEGGRITKIVRYPLPQIDL